MKRTPNPPYAPSLLNSIRSIGYSLETALADLIDNSITAHASNISIRFSPYGKPFVAILDDGDGMTQAELKKAMQHGSTDPNSLRDAGDLGRFGLGLKTASLSQCRKLIVVTTKNGTISAASWDLDVVEEEEDWILLEYEDEDLDGLPMLAQLQEQGRGTLVIWEDLDRILTGEKSIEVALGEKMDLVREHLSQVFHRYILGDQNTKRIHFDMNGNLLEAQDPFLSTHSAIEPMPDEILLIEGQPVHIKPYILPHISKLSNEELARAGGEEGLRKNQGFYIYRNKRLIAWGTWFRLTKQGELSKLARVRIDIPNALDHLWALDIKKSVATPPEIVRSNLRRIVERIADGSKRVYTYRGRKINDTSIVRLWDRYKGRDGVWYQVNRKHPLVTSLVRLSGDEYKSTVEALLKALEENYPIDALYADMASEERLQYDEGETYTKLKGLAAVILKTAASVDGGDKRMIDQLSIIDPFSNYPDITAQIKEELLNGK